MMQTVEEYFAALEEHLKQMPAEDRAEIIRYYREYAQEGDLLDAGQLREHFGPPEALAARILEEGAGKRSPGPEPPGHAGQKAASPAPVWWGILVAAVAFGMVMLHILSPKTTVEGPVPTASGLNNQASRSDASSPDTGEADGGLPLQYEAKVEPFTEIVVDVVAAEIRVELGDDYGLRYDLCEQEIVDRAGVEGQTLYFISHNKPDENGNQRYGQVCITVPAGADLGNLQFSTVSGGVTIPEVSCGCVKLDTVSGDSVLNCAVEDTVTVDGTSASVEFGGQCRQLEMDTTSGGLTFTGQADTVWLDTTSGDLRFSGTAGSVWMNATSGSVRIQGTVTDQVQVDLVSGDIDVTAVDPAVTAEGRDIAYNGQRVGEDSWSRQGSGCTLTLGTVSGSISIQDP